MERDPLNLPPYACHDMDWKQLGPYEIGKRLGKGGMGSVYRGVNVETRESAAIKVLAPQLAMAEGFRERFEAEIESLETLQHEGIVRLFGYGEESGTLFYAMQLVEGRSLEEELKAGRRFNWREVVEITIQICKALKHAHDHGIVHRDIKPANILLDENEDENKQVKLADFGIARLFGGSQMTMAGGVLGTADYMSPEQAEGKAVTDRCDQYSLGCVMYALLAGRPPFQAKSLPEMLQLQRFAEPDPVRRYARDAPAQLELAIAQLLSKDPGDRFPNTLVVARHLEAMRRALSRPSEMDPEKLLESNRSEKLATPGRCSTDLEETKAVSGVDPEDVGPEDLDAGMSLELDGSIDLEVISESAREAATIGGASESLAADNTAREPKRPKHFTKVTDEIKRRPGRLPTLSVLAAGAALIVLVASLGGMVWQLTQPYDVDALYQAIRPEASEPDVDHLRDVTDRIDEFLLRFPGDPRAVEVEAYRQELDLDRLERRFAALARRRVGNEKLLTAERLYLTAIDIAENEPEKSEAKLDHLISLFSAPSSNRLDDSAQRVKACLELARRQRDQLRTRIVAQQKQDLEVLGHQLEAARALHADDPATAKATGLAVVALYRSKPWAEERVREAKSLLAKWALEPTPQGDAE